jgi:cell division protein FtsI (penicillin-binding protein 3)
VSGGKTFRYRIAFVLVGAFAVFVATRYAYLAFTKSPPAAPRPPEIERGFIYDRGGRILAMDSPLYDVAVWNPQVNAGKFREAADRLAQILGLNADDIVAKSKKGDQDFFYLAKRVEPRAAEEVNSAIAASAAAATAAGEKTWSFSGVVVQKVAGRLYPEKRLASHLVGFVGDGNRGRAGIESRYDEELSPLAPSGGARSGESLVLTIDADMQYSLEKVARKAKESTGAAAVILLAVDSATGAILAYVAMPDFDPNAYAASPASDWYDWPSVYHYEPGSVFKVFTMASVVDLGGADASSTFFCDGAYRSEAPSGEKIVIKCLGSHGKVGIADILALSCNAGAAYASMTVGALDFYEKVRSFGFGSRTGIALPSETPGSLAAPGTKTWSLRTQPTIGMGQEVFVSAVQMAAAAGAVANGGTLMKPYVVERAVGPGGETIYSNEPVAVRRVVSQRSSRMILDAMEKGASDAGTGFRAKIGDLRMAVKTGTAQMIDLSTGAYSKDDYIASTLAIFPAEAPRMAVYLAIVKPTLGPSYYGGRIAAPVMKEAVEAILEVSDLPRGLTPAAQAPRAVAIPPIKPAVIGDTMPDLTGVPKRLLMPLLSREDISVKLSGEGYVASQSPAPGSPVAPGAEIVLELR